MGSAARRPGSQPVDKGGQDADAAVQRAGLPLYTNALGLASDFEAYMSSLGRTRQRLLAAVHSRQRAFMAELESETAAGAALYRSLFEEQREQLSQCILRAR
ncbi:hypothetical protein MAC_04999 [Metarhizium acridum CQMa 102]|uniref:Uncharacterized protein n=1 Tax=Metarhizium acridum (strain CQMa 102) TaxID=655827 RepID=E9E5C3_METAQ|nr:uncharacterized protein MAC_04999 [Metarhizium acridum CQMa 102]EFY88905.1 hypothetical protein MAC_04999 [Metarhizium acridum CQMa 102]